MSPSDNIDVRVTLVEWMAALERELGVSFGEVDIDALLDATRVAAHGVARPAGPLTTFAIGFAAGLSTGIATDSSAGRPDPRRPRCGSSRRRRRRSSRRGGPRSRARLVGNSCTSFSYPLY